MGVTVLCTSIIIFCYGKIFLLCCRYRQGILRSVPVLMNKREKKTSMLVWTLNSETIARKISTARHKKASLTMFYILLFFFLCYLPSFAYQITAATTRPREDDSTMRIVYRLTFSIAMVKSALNPVLYCLRIDNVRKAVIKYINNVIHIKWAL